MVTLVTLLDGGFVAHKDHMGSDLSVVNAARVSFAKQSALSDGRLHDRDERLIGYLARHGHWTPFAHTQVTLHIKAPIFVRTQLFKHKVGLVENEVSRRYVTDEPTFYRPNWRSKPTGGAKQGSEDFVQDHAQRERADRMIDAVYASALVTYRTLLESGIAPEQARAALPQGAFTEWWWSGSIAAFARVVRQRSDPHAQWETRQVAEGISAVVAPLYPVSWRALTA